MGVSLRDLAMAAMESFLLVRLRMKAAAWRSRALIFLGAVGFLLLLIALLLRLLAVA